jgi:hypothetical protein
LGYETLPTLSHKESVEEIFIEDFNEAQLIGWLRTNSNNTDYRNLRDKYEPIWSQQSSKLKLAVANFGQDISNLYKLYNEKDDYLIKSSVLRNPAFGDSIGSHWPGINDDKIKELYEVRKPFFDLFEQLFLNPKIRPDFVADLFSTGYYKEVKQKDLALILCYLIQITQQVDGKFTLEAWIEKADYSDECRRAIECIVMFIANYNFKSGKDDIFHNLFVFDDCLALLSDFRIYEPNEKWQVEVLRKFNPESFPKKVLDDPHSDMETVILSIQRWFAKNFFKHSSPDYLNIEFKGSTNVRERSFFYQNSKLSNIFSVEYFRSEYLPSIEDIIWYEEISDETSVAKMVPNKGLEINQEGWSSKEHMIAYEAFEKHLLLDQHRFVGSLACNDSFYRTKRDRDWLQRLCSKSDAYFSLVSADIFIFGTGTCSEIFDSKLAQVQKLYPEEFTDLTEAGMLRAIQTELTELKKIRTTVMGLTSDVNRADTSLAKLLKNQKEIEETTGQKLKELQEQLEQTNTHIKDILHLRGEPTDLISRFVLNTPIIGKILKKLLK